MSQSVVSGRTAPDRNGSEPQERERWLAFQTELLAAVTHPMIVVDTARTIIYWNDAAEAKYGWTSEEAVGRKSVELIKRAETPAQTKAMVDTLMRGEKYSADFEVTRKDGELISVYVTNTPVFDADGRLSVVIGVSADASERRRLSAVVETSSEAVLSVDRHGNISGWNGAAERLYGYAAAEIVGKPVAVLAPEDGREEQDHLARRMLAGGPAECVETTRRRANGSMVDVRITLSPTWSDAGEVTGMSAIAHDITERREAQRALEASERQLADAQRIAHLGSVEVDLVNATISRSGEFCRLLGVPMDHPTADWFLNSILDPSDRSSWVQAWEAIVHDGVSFDLMFRIVRPDGEQRWVRARGHPEIDEHGTVVKVLGTVLDESERVEAEVALHASERLHSAFLDNMPVGVYILGADGEPFYVNRAATEMLGTGPNSGTSIGTDCTFQPGTSDVSLYPDDEQLIVEALAGRHGHNTDTEIRRPDRILPIEVWAKPVRNEQGVVTHAISVFVDITARRQAQEEAAFRAHLLDVAGQSIIATDSSGAITYWNRAAEALYGWSAEEVHGRPIIEITPNETTQDQAAEVIAALQAGAGWSGEFGVQRRDGTTFVAFVTTTPILDASGKVVGAIGVSSDVTDRHALEHQLRQAQRLESLGHLAGGVAHDFNNLLNVILNYGKFVAEATDGEARDDAREIIKAGEAAARLTQQLLTFARREMVELHPLDLNLVVKDVHGLLARSIGEDIELIVRPTEIPVINADRGQIEQILLNLAVNARDAMPDGGTLTIETSVAELDVEYVKLHPEAAPGVYVQLAVSDTGTGMSADVAASAFEPFFTTKEKHVGTGLGLATIHGIVTGAGGAISLHSEEGIGTTIRIYLPIANDPASSQHGADLTEALRGHGQTVLVVEDHTAVRALTVRMLRRNNYEVVEAEDPLDALALASNRRFDLLVTDVIMPTMSGRDVAEHCCRVNPAQRVLYMSGYSDGVLGPSRSLDPGVALLQKPFTEVALLQAVSNALC